MLNKKIAATLLLALLLSAGVSSVRAQDAPRAGASQGTTSVVILDGKARFAIPPGFDKTAVAGEVLTTYQNLATRQALLVMDGAAGSDIDRAMLRELTSHHESDPSRTMPSHRKIGKKELKMAGFDAVQIDTPINSEGAPVLQTTIFLEVGQRAFVIVAISRPDAAAKHQGLVAALQQSVSVTR